MAAGRPDKLKNFIEAFQKVLEENPNNVIYLTDDELRICCNEYLEDECKISDATFENRKAGKIKDSEEYQRFLGLYKNALIKQKSNLFLSLQTDGKSWQRYAWIIERKFSDWNLRHIGENTNTNTNVNTEIKTVDDIKNLTPKQLDELRKSKLAS